MDLSLKLSFLISLLRSLLIVSWVYAHVLLWFCIYNTFQLHLFDVRQLTWCGGQLMVTFILDDLLLKWRKLPSLMQHLSTHLSKVDKKATRVCRVIYFVATFLFLFASVPEFLSDDEYLLQALTLNSVNLTLLSPSTQSLVYRSADLVFILGYYMPIFFVPTVMGCLALYLADLIRRTNLEVKEHLSRGAAALKCADISFIQQKYIALRLLVQRVDSLLSSTLLLWFLASLSTNCNGSIEILMYTNTLDLTSYCCFLAYYLFPLLFSAFLSFCASRIPKAVQEGYLLVRNIAFSCTSGEHCLYGRLLVLMSHVSSPPIGLTIGNMFLITISTFISHIGCIVTFIIVVLQLYPSFMDKLRKQE